jgi:hypothetical protein
MVETKLSQYTRPCSEGRLFFGVHDATKVNPKPPATQPLGREPLDSMGEMRESEGEREDPVQPLDV